MQREADWAAWIVRERGAIDRALAVRRAGALPGPADAESEALRRFRSFAAAALRRSDAGAPALDGLRVDAAAVSRLVDDWCRAAADLAGAREAELRARLEPLAARFRSALVGVAAAHEARRAPRVARRAVSAAIDRIADAFLAIDLDCGAIVDANPAAAALLGTSREALLGAPATRFVAPAGCAGWLNEIETLLESAAPRRFRSSWIDARGEPREVEVHATRHAGRGRTLALVVARVA